MLIEPKEFTVNDQNGNPCHYRLGRIPYLSGGREICSQFVSSAMPKVGDYKLNEDLSRNMFKFVSVVRENGTEQALITDNLVNNHVPDFITGIKIEEAMLEHNLGFSVAGKVREFQQAWKTDLPALITKTLTILRQSLQEQDTAPGKSSKPSIQ